MVAFSSRSLVSLASFVAALPSVFAGFALNSTNNVAVYWGQNSVGQPDSQQRLSDYCNNTHINIIYLSFLTGTDPPATNFASATDRCTPFKDNPKLHYCKEIEADIKTCQDAGKTIILSIGGATYNSGGWTSAADAQAAAQLVWAMFGPPGNTTVNRPFGQSVVNGFDFDFEAVTDKLAAFAGELRKLMDAAGSGKYCLSAAPQCVFPDSAVGAALNAVAFDFIGIQFYNNWCGLTNYKPDTTVQNAYNFDVWSNWTQTQSKNPEVLLLIGAPAAPTAAGAGYVNASQLVEIIQYSQTFHAFGGVMFWDMSQLEYNKGYLEAVVSGAKF